MALAMVRHGCADMAVPRMERAPWAGHVRTRRDKRATRFCNCCREARDPTQRLEGGRSSKPIETARPRTMMDKPLRALHECSGLQQRTTAHPWSRSSPSRNMKG